MKLYIAICDDQHDFAKEFSNQLQLCRCMQNITCELSFFLNAGDLLKSKQHFDVIFLDIKMEEVTGLDAARALRSRKVNSELVFLTAYREYVFQAFDVEAFHYLLKLVDAEKLDEVMSRLLCRIEEKKQFLLIRSGGSTSRVPLCKIMYAEVLDRKVYLHMSEGEVIPYYDKLECLEKRLPEYFCRCHRSYIANLNSVFSYDRQSITLINQEQIPISKRKYEGFSQAFMMRIEKEGIF